MFHPHQLMFPRNSAMVADNGPPRKYDGPLPYLSGMFGQVSHQMPQPFHNFHGTTPVHCQIPTPTQIHVPANYTERATGDAVSGHSNDDIRFKLKGPACTARGCTPSSLPSSERFARQEKSESSSISETKKTFLCPQCKYTTDRKNNLKRHIITMHFDCDRKLECCGSNFRSKAKLREHVTLFHKNGYRCGTCGRVFCRKALLRRHMTVHSGKKDYHCNICSYATSHKSNLERHQKVHKKFASPSGVFLSRKYQIKSTAKLRKNFFEQYRHSIFDRQYLQDFGRKCISYSHDFHGDDNIESDKNELHRSYIDIEHTGEGINQKVFKNEPNCGSSGVVSISDLSQVAADPGHPVMLRSNCEPTQGPVGNGISKFELTQEPNSIVVSNCKSSQEPGRSAMSNCGFEEEPGSGARSNFELTQEPGCSAIKNCELTRDPECSDMSNCKGTQECESSVRGNCKGTQDCESSVRGNCKSTQESGSNTRSNIRHSQEPESNVLGSSESPQESGSSARSIASCISTEVIPEASFQHQHISTVDLNENKIEKQNILLLEMDNTNSDAYASEKCKCQCQENDSKSCKDIQICRTKTAGSSITTVDLEHNKSRTIHKTSDSGFHAIRRRLCDKPYRCNNCCLRFEHQIACLRHVCSQRDIQTCLRSVSLVSMINRHGVMYNPTCFLV